MKLVVNTFDLYTSSGDILLRVKKSLDEAMNKRPKRRCLIAFCDFSIAGPFSNLAASSIETAQVRVHGTTLDER